MLEARRFHRWLGCRDPRSLTVADVADEPPVPTTPHQITPAERAAIIAAAGDKANSDQAHPKLAHHLSRTRQGVRVEVDGAQGAALGAFSRDVPASPRRPSSRPWPKPQLLGLGYPLLSRR